MSQKSAAAGGGNSQSIPRGEASITTARLPWGSVKTIEQSVVVDPNMKPGEYVAKTLMVEFMLHADRKIKAVCLEPVDKHLTKDLQRGEDAQFDQLLTTIGQVAEYSLPSILRILFAWYDQQNRNLNDEHNKGDQKRLQLAAAAKLDSIGKQGAKPALDIGRPDRDYVLEKKGYAVDFIFCLVLIEILKQLPLHPGHEELVNHIVQLAFKQFRYKDATQLGHLYQNAITTVDIFAEVVGVLANSRFSMVRKKFITDLTDLRSKEISIANTRNIVSLLMGMKSFRIKMAPVEEFEMYMNFMHELGRYYLEVKDQDVKHALALVFCEILLPVSGKVKMEVNIPVLKNFVELLYPHTLDAVAKKKKHMLAFFPLLTCLLCISQKQFFLNNWHYFLTMCLSNLKSKDTNISRVALESLYRLLWVYMIRIKCESNAGTQSRLQSITNSLFPKGGRNVIPRDVPSHIFVKIIHFIAQERLDFAFKEIIFDLLNVGRSIRQIYPERMNIGLRALLVIADSLQQRDGPPPMPKSIGVPPSGTTLRAKRQFLYKPLTSDIARVLGIDVYFQQCRRAFDQILKTLDQQIGRPLMMTTVQTLGKDELTGGDRKPKIELFRTCVAAVPRLMPADMNQQEMIDLLVRLTVHVDSELKQLATQALTNLMCECRDLREDVVHGFLQFISKDVNDSYPELLDSALRILYSLVATWKTMVHKSMSRRDSGPTTGAAAVPPISTPSSTQMRSESSALVIHCVEGFALVMMCQGRPGAHKVALSILKECKLLLLMICGTGNEHNEKPVIDVLDSASVYVLERYLPHVPTLDKAAWLSGSTNVDFTFLAERVPFLDNHRDLKDLVNIEHGNEYMQWDAWASALSGFLEPRFLPYEAPTAVAYAWPIAYARIQNVFTYVDVTNPQNDTRASLLRSSKSKATASTLCGEPLNHNNYLSLWQKYLVLTCAIAPATQPSTAAARCASPDALQTSSDCEKSMMDVRIPRTANVSASNLFKFLIPLLRSDMVDMTDSVVLGLSSVAPSSLDCLLDELAPMFREVAERKQEKAQKARKRDSLRLQIMRIMDGAAYRGTMTVGLVLNNSNQLKPQFLDYIENAMIYTESDYDRHADTVKAIRLHYAKFICTLIRYISVDKRYHLMPPSLRTNLFYRFGCWTGSQFGLELVRTRKLYYLDSEHHIGLKHLSVNAMCAVLCCGAIFDEKVINIDNGFIYRWLERILMTNTDQITTIAEETLVLLLEFNADQSTILDWMIDKCYSGNTRVADKCFRAIATVFIAREYPCDQTAILNLTLMYSGYAVVDVQQIAVELLQLLEQRFFGVDINLAVGAAVETDASIMNLAAIHTINRECPELLDTSFMKSQFLLSYQLSMLHPEITLPIFSEITNRFQTAKPARRAALLHYLLPWLYNIELVDPNLEPVDINATLSLPTKMKESQAVAKRTLKGEGWGSAQASEMIMNNMLCLTIKYGNEHSSQLESLWASLVKWWPHNLRVILRYLMVMSTLSPDTVLLYAKRIVIYLARVNSERLVNEVVNELQTIDVFKHPFERTQMPPFFRWIRKNSSDGEELLEHSPTDGVIHTKRHMQNSLDELNQSTEEPNDMATSSAGVEPSASMASLATLKADVLNAKFMSTTRSTFREEDEEEVETLNMALRPSGDQLERLSMEDPLSARRRDHYPPFQLPMPAYGGYYCNLAEYLPDTATPVLLVHRSNLAAILLTDLMIADVEIDWTVHLPTLLHVSILGMDSGRSLIHEHCKQLLVNLIVVNSHTNRVVPARDVARVLITHSLGSQLYLASKALSIDSNHVPVLTSRSGIDSCRSTITSYNSMVTSCVSSSVTASTFSIATAMGLEWTNPLNSTTNDFLVQKDAYSTPLRMSLAELAIAITEFLSSRKGTPLWANEEITPRFWRIASGDQLTNFVSHLNRFLGTVLEPARIGPRWAQTALHTALSCSNRHFAGRSFQIFRALHVPLTSRMLSDILSRLVETVGEQGEDMQGYVTEIMLTLDAAVFHIELAEHKNVVHPELYGDVVNKRFMNGAASNQATPSFMASVVNHLERTSSNGSSNNATSPTHIRSTSAIIRRQIAIDRKDIRCHSTGDPAALGLIGSPANITRSKSATALKSLEEEEQDDHIVSLSQLMWIAVSLMESDYEHEYMMALRLFDKLIDLPEDERTECLERLNRMIQQLNWQNFQGVLSLVLKGCTFLCTFEMSLHVLSKCAKLLDCTMMDVSQHLAFPMLVVALLPYLIKHYEEPTKLCQTAAENISLRCAAEVTRLNMRRMQQEQESGGGANSTPSSNNSTMNEHPLDILCKMMDQYSKTTFCRDSAQWTKCVVNYLCNAYPHSLDTLLSLLVELLERGPEIIHQPTLQVMYFFFNHIDMNSSEAKVKLELNGDFLRSISKHLMVPQSDIWREASRILKLAVTRSSTMIVPTAGLAQSAIDPMDPSRIRTELPGRTMEFSLDVNGVSDLTVNTESILFDHYISQNEWMSAKKPQMAEVRRPALSQGRVRDRLISLLNASGLRVGLPKSPSVIFSQSSHDLPNERHSSAYSSSGDLNTMEGTRLGASGTPSPDQTGTGTSGEDSDSTFPRVFKEFDFLDGEADSMSDSIESGFNYWLHTLSLPKHEDQQGADDESCSNRKSLDSPQGSNSSNGPEIEDEEHENANSDVNSECGSQYEEDASTCSQLDPEVAEVNGQDMERLFVNSRNSQDDRASDHGGDLERTATPASMSMSICSSQVDLYVTPVCQPIYPLECCHHTTGQIEDIWFQHAGFITNLNVRSLNDSFASDSSFSTAETLVSATLIFGQLYKESCSKLCSLIKDASHCLSLSSDISEAFQNALDTLMLVAECPFAFVTPSYLNVCGLLQRQKFFLLELREHYETFLERKEQSIRALHSVKSTKKLRLLGQLQSFSSHDQEVELCRILYKLFFQVKLMYVTYSKMVEHLTSAQNSESAKNLSIEVSVLQNNLLKAVTELASSGSECGSSGASVASASQANNSCRKILLHNLQSGEYRQAIMNLRSLRNPVNRQELGCCDETDIEALLLLYCRMLSENCSCCVVVVESEPKSSENCLQLMETNLQLSATIRSVNDSIRLSRQSDLNVVDV